MRVYKIIKEFITIMNFYDNNDLIIKFYLKMILHTILNIKIKLICAYITQFQNFIINESC